MIMSDKKLSFVSNVVLPIIVAIATIGLFILFKKDDADSLFYLNLFYTLVLEAVFFLYLNFLHTNTRIFSSAFYSIFGVTAIIYIITGALWMLVYSFALTSVFSLKVYIAVIIIITLIWIIVAVLIARTDADYKETVDELKNRQYTLQYYIQKMNILTSRYEKVCAEKGIVYKTDSNNRTVLSNLSNKIGFIMPNVLNNDTTTAQLNAMLEKCGSLIDETDSSVETDKDVMVKKMENFVSNAINEIELLKTLSRK